ncbi:MAG: glycerol-3-phosphate acyltransferase [Proteobacteria bacterium]|nr:glycerol-3-phosphate acyltransferase [Pseudomonadota bacterium]
MPAVLAYLLLVYLVAAVPFGLVITTLYGGDVDIRTAGSGNIGATNVARVYSWNLAGPVMALDMAKGLVPVLLLPVFFNEPPLALQGAVVLTAFLGHCFPAYLEWRGGKGVATGAGGLLGVIPGPTLIAGGLWVVTLMTTGRSSVAALIAVLGVVAATAWMSPWAIPLVVLIGVGVALTHVSNIRRIVAGTETTIVRPVTWGRERPEDAEARDLLEQGPAGRKAREESWDDASREDA